MKTSAISLFLFLSAALTSCTYNVSLVHSEGQATDVIDTAQTPTSDLSPTITIPTIPGV